MNSRNNKTKKGTVLYSSDAMCCGCGSCKHVCPQNAITLVPGTLGSLYPNIDTEKCIGCDLCIKACVFNQPTQQKSLCGFAGVVKDDEILTESSSGGVFSAIAERLLDENYSVCGCILEIENDAADVRHILVDNKEDLKKFRGSKYVQSRLDPCLNQIKKELTEGRKVLFSGTPCQVAAVKKLFWAYAEQLVTIDIICHGTPSLQFFNDYLDNNSLKPQRILFRDKKYGWSHKGTIVQKSGEELAFNKENASYFNLFMAAEIYRESCYRCPYAARNMRPGDITLGDFWGIKTSHPELLQANGGPIVKERGISCVIANSEKGRQLISEINDTCDFYSVNVQDIMAGNPQLCSPARHTKLRDRIINAYRQRGYAGVEKNYQRRARVNRIKLFIIGRIPGKIVRLIR